MPKGDDKTSVENPVATGDAGAGGEPPERVPHKKGQVSHRHHKPKAEDIEVRARWPSREAFCPQSRAGAERLWLLFRSCKRRSRNFASG